MQFFDFITEEELDRLPEDPQAAFVQFVRHADNRLTSRLREVENEDYDQRSDVKYAFQNVVLAVAKQFRIEPFINATVPAIELRSDHKAENYQQFRADLDHYMAQLMISLVYRERAESLNLPAKTADKIRTYIHYLREEVDKAEHLTEPKKAALRRRINALEEELGKKRIRYGAIALIVAEILAIPGAVSQSVDIMAKITTNILRDIGEVKLAQDDEKRVPYGEPAALLPPRPPQSRPARFQREEMDDEIPF